MAAVRQLQSSRTVNRSVVQLSGPQHANATAEPRQLCLAGLGAAKLGITRPLIPLVVRNLRLASAASD